MSQRIVGVELAPIWIDFKPRPIQRIRSLLEAAEVVNSQSLGGIENRPVLSELVLKEAPDLIRLVWRHPYEPLLMMHDWEDYQ